MSYTDKVERKGNLAAFVLAVLAATTVAALMVTASFVFDGSPIEVNPVPIFLLAWVLAALVISAFSIIVGLPLTWFLYRRGFERSWIYPTVGAFVGAPIFPTIFLQSNDWGPNPPLDLIVFAAATGAIPGAIAGFIWWCNGRRPALAMEADAAV